MNRFLLTICLAWVGITYAWAIGQPLTPPSETPVITQLTEFTPASNPAQARKAADSWGEWQQGFTGTINQTIETTLRDFCDSNGEQWVDFPEHFTILTRENTDNPRLVQYKMVDVFNHVDIILDYNRDTQILYAADQDTGIAIADRSIRPDCYETYHFAVNPVKMFELSKNIYKIVNPDYAPYFLLVAPNYGYGINISYFFFFDNIPDYHISCDNFTPYLSSEETSRTISLNIPEGVVNYRLLKMSSDELDNTTSSFFQNLYLKNPEEPAGDYTTCDSPSLTTTPDEVRSYYFLIPLDEDGKAAYYETTVKTLWNKPLAGEWTPVGTATMKDNLWGFALDDYSKDYPFLDYTTDEYYPTFTGEAPAIHEVTVEALSTNPAVYRFKNPFGPTHPYYQFFFQPTDTDDDFYMVIDTTDPSHVVFQPTLAGFTTNQYYDISPFIFENSTNEQYFGKFTDGKITIPLDAIRFNYASVWLYDLLTDVTLEIEMPGYVDYSMKPLATEMDETSLNGYLTEISPNVAKIEYALFDSNLYDDELRRFPEKLGKMIADRAEGVKVYSAIPAADRTATLTIPREELPYGFFAMVAVGVDAQGNHHASYVVNRYPSYNPTPLSQWPSAGNSTLNGWFIQGWTFSDKENTHPVDLRVSPDQEGVYCLCDAFKAEYDYLIDNSNNAGEIFSYDNSDNPVYINASNPNEVFISDDPKASSTLYLGMETGLSSTDTGNYTLYQFSVPRGKRYTDNRGMEVIDLSEAIAVSVNGVYFYCNPFIITIDYDADKDLSSPVNWDNVATVTVEENLFNIQDGNSTIATHECQLNRHPAHDHIYALIDPFRESGPVNPNWTFDGGEHHLILDVTDPDQVFFDGGSTWDHAGIIPSGYTHTQDGPTDMILMVNAIRQSLFTDITDPAPYYGTAVYNDPDNPAIPSLINLDKGICIYFNELGYVEISNDYHFRIILKESGVDTVADDETTGNEAVTIWYNLQGVRVAAPDAPGVYIRVSGNRTEKVAVR